MIKDLIRPSGGLYYHLRAWRHGRSWQPFREQLEKWLDSWNCPHKELILLGPSAGYSLPDSWLKNFSSIQAFDLDPLAGPLFRLRHPGVPIEFCRANLFWQEGRLSTAPLEKVLDAHPQTPVLFCNVLGQILLEGHASEEEWTAFLRRLRELLNGRSWASYHDVQTQEGSTAVDHMTDGDWCSDLPVQKFEWQMSPSSRHFLAGIRA